MTVAGNAASVELEANAKVNVCLLVTGKRTDGYHEVVTLMAPITLTDRVVITRRPGPLAVSCRGADLPCDERNLVTRAARIFFEYGGGSDAVAIEIIKNIPVGGGLGGGSSDAAATLRGLNDLYGSLLSTDEVARLAGTLGADVPFFLGSAWGLATGRGDVLTGVRGRAGVPLLLAGPIRGISTARVYANVKPGDYADSINPLWDVAAALALPGKGWWDKGVNSLEAAACRTFPVLTRVKAELLEAGYGGARLSGSGGTYVVPVENTEQAEETAARLRDQGRWATLTYTK